jgi:excisionase family DNA binding protein
MGMGAGTVKARIARGEIPSVRIGGQLLVRLKALQEYLERQRDPQPPPRARTPAALAAARKQYEFIVNGLPADRLARLEALHEKIEAEQPLSRAERYEVVALEGELTKLAGQRLREWANRLPTSTE